jgi:hypothetical protein
MTGDLVQDLLISAAGVGVIVVLTYLLGAWRNVRVDETSARERLEFDEPDFQPAVWMVGADGKAAAALSGDGGEIAVVFALGDGLATRRMRRGAASIAARGSVVTILLGDATKSKISLPAPDAAAAAQWTARLRGTGTNGVS